MPADVIEPVGKGYSRREHRIGVALVMLAGVFWSVGGVVVRLMDTTNAWQILFYRSIFVCLLVLVVMLARAGRTQSVLAPFFHAGLTGVVAGLGVALAFSGFILALVYTSVANTFFLLATQPFLIAVLAWIVLREKLERATLAAAVLTTVGVAIMFHEGLTLGSVKGNVFGLLSAVGFSIFTVALRFGRDVDMWPAIFYGGFFAVLFAAVMLITDDHGFAVTYGDLAWCAVLGITQIGLGTLAYIAGSKWVSAAELGLLAMTEIVLGPFWAWLIVNEVPGRGTMVGGALVLISLIGLGLYRVMSPSPGPEPSV